MATEQTQDLCVYENESVTILLEVFDEDDELLDLTGARVLMVVWDPITDTASFTKDSDVGPSEVEILNQITDTGKAKIFILPADITTKAVLKYNIWVDLISGEQHLVVRPSRFEILDSKRS